jgi:hypothetical protein
MGPFVVKDGRLGFLACNHVVACNGRIPLHSVVRAETGNGEFNAVGTLAAWDFLDDSPGAVNQTDSALVYLNPGFRPPPRLQTANRAVGPPQSGQRVFKHGPASNLTRGRIVCTGFEALVPYDFGTYRFVSQLAIEGDDGKPFAAAGDSGSVVYSDDSESPRPLAMIWGGRREVAFAAPLTRILARLSVTLLW